MAHLHITAWIVAFILLFLVVSFYKQGKKQGKILHMILRLDYLILLYSGGSMLGWYSKISGELVIKIIAGILAIAAMEMIAVKTNKQKPTKTWWIVFIVSALIAIILGFTRLPFGILP